MAKKKKAVRQSKRQKARRRKAYIARLVMLILAIAAVAGVVFLAVKFFGSLKDKLPELPSAEEKAEETEDSSSSYIITINKDGSLTETSVEDFDTKEYDAEELKKMVNDTISDYNGSGEEKISLKSLEIKDGIARAVINYASDKDYAAYNEKTFVIGDVSDLDITGVTLADDKNTVLTKDAMPKVKGSYVLLNDDTTVVVPKEIQYVSRNVKKTGKKTAEVKKAGIDSVIIYK
ncbi:MAG: hypothetical protein IJP84_06900 [Lachnospiraceae bacterium]|nr:hypothetical protein [Lachnospiraceae bacterium]